MASYFSLLAGHELAYNEIVKPTRRWAFSYYFLYRWLPRLHPQQAMLIQVLRQSTWQQGRPTGRCQLANATLCRLMGWSESSHKTLLAELERPLSSWFIRRERTRKRHATEGHAVEGSPRYRVTMDEPLTPGDQVALRCLLAQQQPPTPYAAAELLSHLSGKRSLELWQLLDQQETPATLPDLPATVAMIAALAWPHLADALPKSRVFLEAAERLQLRLTGAGYAHLELDYLLRSWLPTLGISQSWLVIVLRARCFHDPATGESRDVVVVQRRELEQQLGLPERTFRRLLRDESSLSLFGVSPAGEPLDPDERRHFPARGALAFHVAFPLLPVAPPDQDRYVSYLLRQAGPELSAGGQTTHLEAARQPGSPEGAIRRRPANPAGSGQTTHLIRSKAATRPSSSRPHNPSDSRRDGHATRLIPASQPDIQSAFRSNQHPEPTDLTAPSALGRGEGVRELLQPFRIQGISRILSNPEISPDLVRGWILRGREEVSEEKLAGYLFRRLSDPAAEPLPALYRLAGAVDTAEEVLFERWWLDEVSPLPVQDEAQRQRYGAWRQLVKQERGEPDRPDFSPHACWRRELARSQQPSA